MAFQQDWIMRQIDMLTVFIAKVFFKKEVIKYEVFDEEHMSGSDLLYQRLKAMLQVHDICGAENLLFESLDTGDDRYLELAVDFYQSLNQMSDEELENSDFSREEIQEGIDEVLKKFGLSESLLLQ